MQIMEDFKLIWRELRQFHRDIWRLARTNGIALLFVYTVYISMTGLFAMAIYTIFFKG